MLKFVTRDVDTGDVIKIETIEVGDDEMLESLFNRLTNTAADLTVDVLKNYSSYKQEPQVDALSTHCSKISKADGEVEFINALTLYNKYRAFTPWPGIYLNSGLKLKKIILEDTVSSNAAGMILEINSDSIVVGCSEGSVRIFSVQAPSKKEIDVLSYINGKRLTLEDTIS